MTTETDLTQPSQLIELLKTEHEALQREGRALAELIGMSQAHLEKLLSGEKQPGAQSLKKITAYFAGNRQSAGRMEARLTPATPIQSPFGGPSGATIRVVELGAVQQRQYIAAMLEASGIPKGIASYVGLHVNLEGTLSPAEGLRAAQALAREMLAEEAADD